MTEVPDEELPDEAALRRQFEEIMSAIPPETNEYFRQSRELALADVDSDLLLLKILRISTALGLIVIVGSAVTGITSWILAISLCVTFILIVHLVVRPVLFALKKRRFSRSLSRISDKHYGP